MGKRILLTGGTGYVGGSVLTALTTAHPEYEITVLLRKVPSDFEARYPTVNIAHGELDQVDKIRDLSAKNDIVILCGKSGKHIPALEAHIEGLLQRDTPTFLIRLAGTSIIADFWEGNAHGELNEKVWSDVDHVDEITSLPDNYQHRPVDKILHRAAEEHPDRLNVAIICPPGIYGQGRGAGNTQSLFLPEYYEEIIKLGRSFYAGSGKNTRGWVHIDDLVKVYVALVESAVAGGGNATWGREGYYFAESQEASQKEMAKHAGKILKARGLVAQAEPVQLSIDTVREMRGGSSWEPMGIYTWASNTRTRGDRARKLLGYKPNAPSLWETMEEDFLVAKTVLEQKA
ncbi:NAD dependent epimerase-like protein 3 [Elsinoe australis]|uniref:NAD dependent epimerase-like protein 3 n=1 Tax=Elsinoe australis TaxID=40998 RepID=A0A4U7B802_9PEZI|nr:NAD dependent epimerase-like protein 3 [Elsinoe australis]